jgi:hypothetical protein
MADTRHRDRQWNVGETVNGWNWEQGKLAVLMDIRDELKRLNGLLHCQNFIEIPYRLDAIRRNTATRRKYNKTKGPKNGDH